MSPKIAAICAGPTVITFFGLVAAPLIVPQLIYLHDLANANRPTLEEIIETHPETRRCIRRANVATPWMGGSMNRRGGHAAATAWVNKLPSISHRMIRASLLMSAHRHCS